ncbi:MAG: phenol hydroxylase [Rhodocyclaceae bacterium]|nr:MAG: phenol hydroxylase [Rhodocyclaceae bacterium]
MSVVAIKEYVGVPRDLEANYHGNIMTYITWEKHLMFAAPFIFPVPPSMLFGDYIKAIAGVIQPHPDAAKIDWSKVEWRKSYQPWQPDMAKTLAENGITHKCHMSFRTPGLDGIRGLGI